MALLIKPGEAASHMSQLEGPMTKEYATMYQGALGRKRKKIKSLKKKELNIGSKLCGARVEM